MIAGNPARPIRTLKEHYEIREVKTEEEAKLHINPELFMEQYLN